MKVGSIIKAVDFPGSADCYMIGKVLEVKDMMITAKIITVMPQDKDVTYLYEDGDTFRTPVQGASFLDTSFQRIVVLG